MTHVLFRVYFRALHHLRFGTRKWLSIKDEGRTVDGLVILLTSQMKYDIIITHDVKRISVKPRVEGTPFRYQ